MGISFEYGSRKATNGPMIFFSDPVSEVNLQEEIRGAIESRLCFYAYRLPGDMMVSFGSSEGTVEGLGKPGFVIAPFFPGTPILTIPYAPTPRNNAQEFFPFPYHSTSRPEYYKEIENILSFIDSDDNRKVVAARVKTLSANVDVAATFLNLSKTYPDAYTFCFSTPQTGCWIGAAPELLINKRKERITTMALAGTRKADTDVEWDSKNIMEQQMVTDYIVNTFACNGLNVNIGKTHTRRAGRIEHLCTQVEATDGENFNTPEAILRLITSLAPTPATAGVPREKALEIIKISEVFHRAYYGGFCGPFRSPDDFTLFVILRCARVETGRVALFAGGGITARSISEQEWDETEMKFDTLNNLLCYE